MVENSRNQKFEFEEAKGRIENKLLENFLEYEKKYEEIETRKNELEDIEEKLNSLN